MKPKPNVVVVGWRPELRVMLRIAAGINVWEAESLPQFVKCLSAPELVRLVIIDRRDAPILARRAVDYLRRLPSKVPTMLIARREPQRREPVCDSTLRDGVMFNDRLLNSARIAIIRKRGPAKGSHHQCPC